MAENIFLDEEGLRCRLVYRKRSTWVRLQKRTVWGTWQTVGSACTENGGLPHLVLEGLLINHHNHVNRRKRERA